MPNSQEKHLVSKLFTQLLDPSNPQELKHKTHDLFVQVNNLNGEVALFNDNDECLDRIEVESWCQENEELNSEIVKTLKLAIVELQAKGFWDNMIFDLPFSIELIDDSFNTKEVLFFLDDDIVPITAPLLEGHKEELAQFLEKLLQD